MYDRWGVTPLYLASETGDARLVAILLAMGADPSLCTSRETGCVPPLVAAATHGHVTCLQYLLAAHAPIDAPDLWGNTAILKACQSGHVACLQLLLEHRADPLISNHSGATPILLATYLSDTQILQVLLDSQKYDMLSSVVYSALCSSAARGHHKAVKVLLNSGCPANASSPNPEMPDALFCALSFCASDDRDDLMQESVAPSLQDGGKCICLLLNAGSQTSTQCVELLPQLLTASDDRHIRTVTQVLISLPFGNIIRDSIEYNALTQILLHTKDFLNKEDSNKIVNSIFKLGYKPNNELLSILQAEGVLEGFIFKGVPSLFSFSTRKVRSCLTPNVLVASSELPLPTPLKKALL